MELVEAYVKHPVRLVFSWVNQELKDCQPAHVVIFTAGASFGVAFLYNQIFHRVSVGFSPPFLYTNAALCAGAIDQKGKAKVFQHDEETTCGPKAN